MNEEEQNRFLDDLNPTELEKLGHNFFPGTSAEEFRDILLSLISHEVSGKDEESWAWIEEDTRRSFPQGFRKIFEKPLEIWAAFEIFGMGSITCGVLRHSPTGLCRPILYNPENLPPFIGHALKKFSREAGALAALKMLEFQCRIGSPCADTIVNYVPDVLSQEQLKEVYALGWYGSDLDEYFKESYREKPRKRRAKTT